MIDSAFGRVLRRLRMANELSQETFGYRAGLHRTYVSQLERGLKSPSLGTICQIAQALGLSVTGLLAQVEAELQSISGDRNG
jgi:transcriptional regulator with XRE-family HTH domain